MSNTARRLLPLLLLAGATAGLVGAVAPWVPHQTAGLRIGGFDLFEVTKYLPAVRSGAVPLLREAFLLPLAISAVLLSLVPSVPGGPRRAARWLFPVVAAVVALAFIPPYPQILTAHRDVEYRGQLLLSAGTLLLALLSPLASRLPARLVAGLVSGLAAVGIVLPLIQFNRARALLAELYNTPVGVGWGLVVCVLGLGTVLVGGVWWLFSPSSPER